jgi:hypothetical protein
MIAGGPASPIKAGNGPCRGDQAVAQITAVLQRQHRGTVPVNEESESVSMRERS